MNEQRQVSSLDEWKVTYDATMHFNDLLMRLRTLGLPAVITITGAAAAYGMDKVMLRVAFWGIGLAMALLVCLLTAINVWLSRAPYFSQEKTPKERQDICLWSYEWFAWRIAPIVTGIYTVYFFVTKGSMLCDYKDIPIAIFLITFGLMLLIAFYSLDRYYYYCLLIGAVTRLEALEDELHFHTTRTISDTTPRHRSATVITLLYFLPGTIGLITVLTFLVI